MQGRLVESPVVFLMRSHYLRTYHKSFRLPERRQGFDKYTISLSAGRNSHSAHATVWRHILKFYFGITAILMLWLNTNRRKMRLKNILI